MLKKLYLKYFIFFLPFLSYNFCSYGTLFDDSGYSDAELRAMGLRYARQGGFGNGYVPVKDNTTFISAINRSVKQGTANGTADALTRVTLNVISTVLQIIPYSVNKIISLMKIYAYKMSFGTTGLTAKDLTKFSNRIHSLCTPLASAQTGNLRKTRRANVIEGEQTNGQVVDPTWINDWRPELISELEHIVAFLKNVLPCYNAAYQSIEASLFERKMAAILYALSTENNNEIQSYIIRLIGYINKLIKLLQSFNSFDNAVEHYEDTKRLLNNIRTTFELISSFLGDSNVKGSTGFQKMTDDIGGNKRDIMDLLGNGGNLLK